MAQVCAETLGVDYRRVRVIHGQTDRIAFGIGAHASRATVMTASATHVAALKLRDKALDMRRELHAGARRAISTSSTARGSHRTAAAPRSRLGEIAHRIAPTSKTLRGRDPGLSAEGWFDVERQVYPYGSHVAVVRVDPETGGVTVERYIIGYDVGRAINPMLVGARSSAASRKGSAARCTRSSATARTAIRCPRRSPTI